MLSRYHRVRRPKTIRHLRTLVCVQFHPVCLALDCSCSCGQPGPWQLSRRIIEHEPYLQSYAEVGHRQVVVSVATHPVSSPPCDRCELRQASNPIPTRRTVYGRCCPPQRWSYFFGIKTGDRDPIINELWCGIVILLPVNRREACNRCSNNCQLFVQGEIVAPHALCCWPRKKAGQQKLPGHIVGIRTT